MVTGMHLLREHGYSVQEIEADGFPITERVEMSVAGDTPSAWVKSLGVSSSASGKCSRRSHPISCWSPVIAAKC